MSKFEKLGLKMGLIKDRIDTRDHILSIPLNQIPQMPSKFDLKHKIKRIFKQEYNDCSSNVICNVLMSIRDDDIELSRLYQYFNSRITNSSFYLADNGATYRDSLKALQKCGFVKEETWCYTNENLNKEPSDEAYQEGDKNKWFITCYRKIVATKLNIKYNLFTGNLIMCGIALYDNFLDLDKNFVVPMPRQNNSFEGNHACILAGWSDELQSFLILNSWGESFGQNGYCYIPYEYILNPNLAFDFWCIFSKNS